jgi:hypothetical protein
LNNRVTLYILVILLFFNISTTLAWHPHTQP